MPNIKIKKKKKRELEIKIRDQQDEITQLRAVLYESQQYADKLVACIPYLPADILTLRKANASMANELQKISKKKKNCNKNSDFIKRFKSISNLMINMNQAQEFPGPYSVAKSGELNIYMVKSKNGSILLSSVNKDLIDIVASLMNLSREFIIDEIEVVE